MYDKVGIIYDLKSENFLFNGVAYLLEEKVFQDGSFVEFISGSKTKEKMVNMNLAFAKKIQEIQEKNKQEDIIKTEKIKNIEISEYFKEKRNSILDIVLLPHSNIDMFSADIASSFSIIYFKIDEKIKMGFFVNKEIAGILFPDKVKTSLKINKNNLKMEK